MTVTNIDVMTTDSPVKVDVSWTLSPTTPDNTPDSLTLTLQYSNHSVSQVYTLYGSQTEYCVEVVPGMEYRVLITSHNQDGDSTSEPFNFQTDPAGKLC